MKILFVYGRNPKNTGDMVSCPYFYFKDYFDKFEVHIIDIADFEEYNPPSVTKDDVVIFGGGAIIEWHTNYHQRMNELAGQCGKSIIWGVGTNKNLELEIEEQLNYDAITLVGMRDYPPKYEYIPCVSCMSSEFDQAFDIKRETGAFLHYQGTNDKFNSLPRITNSYDFSDIIRFIGESNSVLTNSFHGCYWSQLLCKPVVKINPHSDTEEHGEVRFLKMKNVPVMRNELDFSGAETYPDFLEESRGLNKQFFEKVKEIIER